MNFKKTAIVGCILFYSMGAVAEEAKGSLYSSIKSQVENSNASKKASKTKLTYAKGEAVVITTTTNSINRSMSNKDIEVIKSFPLVSPVSTRGMTVQKNVVVLRSKTMSTADLVNAAKNMPGVETAEPNYVYHKTATPNDPMMSDLWGLNNTGQTGGTADADIDAPEAWDTTRGSKSVIVGVIDTGVDYLHPDLAPNMWKNMAEANGTPGVDDDGNGFVDDIYGINTITGAGDPMDDEGHGTHVSGTIGAVGHNDLGVVGVNHRVSIAGCKFLDASGSGYTADAIECVNYFNGLKQAGHNIVVTNNSWGGGSQSEVLNVAIEAGGDLGIIFAAAAGNSGSSSPFYPSGGDSEYIVSVAATDHNDELASFSNYGTPHVDLAAPGVSIMSTLPTTIGVDFDPSNALWVDDFENGDGNWEISKEGNTNGWAFVNDNGNNVLDDSPEGNYTNNLLSTIELNNSIDLSTTSGGVCVGFDIKGENEARYDFLNVMVSADGGNNWEEVDSIDGSFGTWTKTGVMVPEQYRTADFRMALVRDTDYSVVRSGYQIDNVMVTQQCDGENIDPNNAVWMDDFESGDGNWEVNFEQHDGWIVTENEENNVLDDSPTGNYPNDLLTTAELNNSIDLTVANGDVCVGFDIRGENEAGFDFLNVMVSADGGNNWEEVDSIDGSFGTWTKTGVMVPEQYRTADFRMALVRDTDYSVVRSGYQIDNVMVVEQCGLSVQENYGSYNGTSMATPHVAGAIALTAAIDRNQSAANRINNLFISVDEIPGLTGQVVTNGRLNVNTMVQNAAPVRNPAPRPPRRIPPRVNSRSR